jgi:hypothetical protein
MFVRRRILGFVVIGFRGSFFRGWVRRLRLRQLILMVVFSLEYRLHKMNNIKRNPREFVLQNVIIKYIFF